MNIEQSKDAINRILEQLERDSGQLVESVEIRNLNVTKFSDPAVQWLRSIEIELRPMPGAKWQ